MELGASGALLVPVPDPRKKSAESANTPPKLIEFYIIITNERTCGVIGENIWLAHGKRADRTRT
jgi:hypothetical protein